MKAEEKNGAVASKVDEAKEAKEEEEKELEQMVHHLGQLAAQVDEKSQLVKESRRLVTLDTLSVSFGEKGGRSPYCLC